MEQLPFFPEGFFRPSTPPDNRDGLRWPWSGILPAICCFLTPNAELRGMRPAYPAIRQSIRVGCTAQSPRLIGGAPLRIPAAVTVLTQKSGTLYTGSGSSEPITGMAAREKGKAQRRAQLKP